MFDVDYPPLLPNGIHVCEYVLPASPSTAAWPAALKVVTHRCCTGYHRSSLDPHRCISGNSVNFNPFSSEGWSLGNGEQYLVAVSLILLALVLLMVVSLWLAYLFHYRQQWAGMSEEEHPLGQLRRRLRRGRVSRRGHHVLSDHCSGEEGGGDQKLNKDSTQQQEEGPCDGDQSASK